MPIEGTIERLLALAERCRRLAASITDHQSSQGILEVAEACEAVVAELRKGYRRLVPASVTRDATRQGPRASSLSALFGNPPWTFATSGGRAEGLRSPDVMDDAHLVVAVAAEIVTPLRR
jgi:hypothetical protein